jgi:hypothetical protein
LQVICNSSKIVLKLDSEPYVPQANPMQIQERKRTIADMYHYYNYILMNKNNNNASASLDRSNFEDIDSRLLLLKMDKMDEVASAALGFNGHTQSKKHESDNSFKNPAISIRYSNEDLLKIFKNLGRFEHPL